MGSIDSIQNIFGFFDAIRYQTSFLIIFLFQSKVDDFLDIFRNNSNHRSATYWWQVSSKTERYLCRKFGLEQRNHGKWKGAVVRPFCRLPHYKYWILKH